MKQRKTTIKVIEPKPVEVVLDTNNPGFRTELIESSSRHLLGLETYAMPYTVDGIPVLRAYTYELIQILNHTWLNNRLKKEESNV